MAKAVANEVQRQLPTLSTCDICGPAWENFGSITVAEDRETAVLLMDDLAPEHLEIQTRDPEALVGRIRNAGAVFVGPHAPVPLGDYSAGSNHVLPTSGTARHSSGLNTVTFLRLQQRIRYTETGLEEGADEIGVLAEDERLPLAPGEVPVLKRVRFRTLGCWPLTAAVESDAETLEQVVAETLGARTSERQGRLIDHDGAGSMERKKQEGYF